MIYYALAIITATNVTVADVYTTLEPCQRDARQFTRILLDPANNVQCIATTEPDAERAERQLTNIKIFLKPPC